MAITPTVLAVLSREQLRALTVLSEENNRVYSCKCATMEQGPAQTVPAMFSAESRRSEVKVTEDQHPQVRRIGGEV